MSIPSLVVLDTNVVLDLILFADRRVSALANAVAGDHVKLVTRADCLEELRRVLCYPAFALSDEDQNALLNRYRSIACESVAAVRSLESFRLRCRDADDQKFLELAWITGASLLTRDKALLVLHRRFKAQGGNMICQPESLFVPVKSACAANPVHLPLQAVADLGHNFAFAPPTVPMAQSPHRPYHPQET